MFVRAARFPTATGTVAEQAHFFSHKKFFIKNFFIKNFTWKIFYIKFFDPLCPTPWPRRITFFTIKKFFKKKKHEKKFLGSLFLCKKKWASSSMPVAEEAHSRASLFSIKTRVRAQIPRWSACKRMVACSILYEIHAHLINKRARCRHY